MENSIYIFLNHPLLALIFLDRENIYHVTCYNNFPSKELNIIPENYILFSKVSFVCDIKGLGSIYVVLVITSL